MDNNNQPACPPRFTSYDMALDHKITNQYMNNAQPIQQSSIYAHNHPVPVKEASQYSNFSQPSSNYYASLNRPNPNYSQRITPQRMNTGDLSMQPVSANPQTNINLAPAINNNSNYSDFNNNFYNQNNESKTPSFFEVVPNLKNMFKQSKLSKWTLIFIILQVIIIVTLETLLYFDTDYFYDKIEQLYPYIEDKHKEKFGSQLNQSLSLTIYQFIFIVAQLFVLVFYYDSFRISSSIQLVSMSVFNFIIAAYSIFQIYQTSILYNTFETIIKDNIYEINEHIDKIDKFEELPNITSSNKYNEIKQYVISISIVLSISAIVLLIMSFFLFKKFGWNIYRNVGADITKTVILKRRYTFGIVLKFKVFFIFGIIAQCYMFSDRKTLKDIKLSFDDPWNSLNIIVQKCAYIALSIILIINVISGFVAVKKKNTFLMIIYILTDMIFIVFSVYMIYIIRWGGERVYEAVRKSLTGFAVIEILLLLVSMYYSLTVMVDFNTLDLSETNKNNNIGRRLSL